MEHLSNADIIRECKQHLAIADRCRDEVIADELVSPSGRDRLIEQGNQLERAARVLDFIAARLG